jgi:hypothetical protein
MRNYAREWRKKHRDKIKEYDKKRPDYGKQSRLVHEKAIRKLGGKCVRCGETDIRVLQINHINGGGCRELSRRKATSFYRDIVAGRRKTDDLDVRCANCNILARYKE